MPENAVYRPMPKATHRIDNARQIEKVRGMMPWISSA